MIISKRHLGQLIMAGIPGPTLDPETKELIREYGLCNFIFFKRNVEGGPEQARALVKSLQELCREHGLPEPLISADQEGGQVQRLGPPHWPAIPGNGKVAAALDPLHAVDSQVEEIARSLDSVGINLNLAPVLDVRPPDAPGVLQGRTFGQDPRTVAYLGVAYVRKLQFLGIGATAKHFPGIGRAEQDPHEKRPVVSTDRETIFRELKPFEFAIEMGVQAIMTSHVVYTDLDPDNPATFSGPIVTDLLRNIMGYRGVVITDDLEMGGITDYAETGDAALRALKAGHDLLLICHRPQRVFQALEALESALNQGDIQEDEILSHLNRIEQLRRLTILRRR